MPALTQQHCWNHGAREAVAQCPQCRHFFCRECITEHDDRVLCASCLRKSVPETKVRRNYLQPVFRLSLGLAGCLTAALFFYWLGQSLLLIPMSFHDGTVWQIFDAWKQ